MEVNKVAVDSNLLETTSHGNREFPMDVYRDNFSKYYTNIINWHWHPEIEFVMITKGKIEYSTEEETLILSEGDGIFINSNTLHMAKSIDGYQDSLMFSVVVSPKLIYNDTESIIYKKYVKPIVECSKLSYLKLHKSNTWQKQILSHLLYIDALKFNEEHGFEFIIKNQISLIWQLIALNTSHLYLHNNCPINSHSLSQERLKQMLRFIHKNYFKNITIDDIAKSANISRSECFRCFKKMINTKPFSYLTDFRLEKSLQLLLETDIPVSDICYSCGFNHSSYYGKLFKEKFGISPSSYRKSSAVSNKHI